MFALIIIPLCLHIQNMPLPLIKYLKNNANMGINNLQEKDISWEKTNNCKNIIDKYFHNMNIKKYQNNDVNIYGEMFKIFGYPATLIIINNKFNYIEEFIINKNLIMMFDAAPIMRWTYYKKFKNIKFKNAINKNIFMII
tara:strand:- start:7683 stop:8102 length:420 start_codon:yes stop_codon:yes gene_type:complete